MLHVWIVLSNIKLTISSYCLHLVIVIVVTIYNTPPPSCFHYVTFVRIEQAKYCYFRNSPETGRLCFWHHSCELWNQRLTLSISFMADLTLTGNRRREISGGGDCLQRNGIQVIFPESLLRVLYVWNGSPCFKTPLCRRTDVNMRRNPIASTVQRLCIK